MPRRLHSRNFDKRILWTDPQHAGLIVGATLYYECFSGISGDMHLGAMVDLGVPLEYLQSELSRLSLGNEYDLVVQRDKKMGISGTKATVNIDQAAEPGHRHLPRIEKMIEAAGFNESIEDTAKKIFRVLAEAEAHVHGIGVNEVHFHEVGATDSIVDIVAAAIAIDYLKPNKIYCGPVELGSGMVKCAHGLMPVPAPATAEILKGVPTTRGRVSSEATTPTGAAILKTIVDEFSTPTSFVANTVAYGLGQKDFEIPNLLRASLGNNAVGINDFESEQNIEIEVNLDDMSPEAYEPLMAQLFRVGAKDVFLTPISMKKSRPGTKLSVLVDPELQNAILNILFSESTTLGARIHKVHKHMLKREQRKLITSFGELSVKIVTLPDGTTRWKSEHDHIARIAQESDVPYLRVKETIDAEIKSIIDNG
ncbi:MAG TPA: nickel pincer cofactor biosynthesis protein LarC [Gammaproteobacteria bacterium]|nr:nickel pincer cofactor biosynthesis protein LarC [Gammaproteobacteria bacterium]